jgi:multiple sugar transport system permease protein
MRQFYQGVPDELEEAAYVDGAGVFKTFVRIILPMSIPMMVTIFMFSFAWQWSDTFYTNTFFPTTDKFVFLSRIVNKIPKSLDTHYAGEVAFTTAINNTCGILILAPLVVFYLFGQKYLVQGIERSGITG